MSWMIPQFKTVWTNSVGGLWSHDAVMILILSVTSFCILIRLQLLWLRLPLLKWEVLLIFKERWWEQRFIGLLAESTDQSVLSNVFHVFLTCSGYVRGNSLHIVSQYDQENKAHKRLNGLKPQLPSSPQNVLKVDRNSFAYILKHKQRSL